MYPRGALTPPVFRALPIVGRGYPLGPLQPQPSGPTWLQVQIAAATALAAMEADPNYCAGFLPQSDGSCRSAACQAVHQFKIVWDLYTSGVDGNPLPHNGRYDAATQQAMQQALANQGTGVPTGCGATPGMGAYTRGALTPPLREMAPVAFRPQAPAPAAGESQWVPIINLAVPTNILSKLGGPGDPPVSSPLPAIPVSAGQSLLGPYLDVVPGARWNLWYAFVGVLQGGPGGTRYVGQWYLFSQQQTASQYFGALPARGTLGSTPQGQPMYPFQGLGAGAAASDHANAAYDAAAAANDAITADASYCAHVGTTGTDVNTKVHAFKAAYNVWATGGDADSPTTGTLPINTGKFEPVVAAAIVSLLGYGPTGCSGVTPPPNPVICADGTTHPAGFQCPQVVTCPDGTTHPAGYQCPAPQQQQAASTTPWGWIIGGVAVLAVGGVALVAASKSRGGMRTPASPHTPSRRIAVRRHAPMNRRLPAHARA